MEKKNRILVVVIGLLMTLGVHAQTEKGRLTIEPHIGMTVANFVGSSSDGSTGKVGLMGGFDFQYGISDRWSFSMGANYAQYGARDYGEHGMMGYVQPIPTKELPIGGTYGIAISENNHVNYHVNYLTFPMTIAFHPYQGLFLRAGVQLNVRMNSKMKGKSTIYGAFLPVEESTYVTDGTGITHLDVDTDLDDDIKPIDLGIPVGIGYEYKNLTFDVRYLFGLLNISKEDNEHLRNSAFMFTLGYKLPFAKR